jgi:hypothetical protein
VRVEEEKEDREGEDEKKRKEEGIKKRQSYQKISL